MSTLPAMRWLLTIVLSFTSLALGCESEVADKSGADGAANATGEGTTGGGGTGGGTDTLSLSVVEFSGDGDTVVVGWPAVDEPNARLVITQGEIVVKITAAAGEAEVQVPGDVNESELTVFSPGDATFQVEVSDAADFAGSRIAASGTMTLSERFTIFFDNGFTSGFPLPLGGLPKHAAPGTQVTLNGNSGPQGIQSKVYVARPDGKVDVIELAGDPILAPNTAYSFDYKFDLAGLYAVEVLQYSALPAANYPVYVGTRFPIIPPAMDGQPSPLAQNPIPVDMVRSTLLAKINAVRKTAGLNELVAHPLADQTAQKKAGQMAAAGQLVHVSNDGKIQKVGELAAEVGLSGFVSENFGLETDLERLFGALYWSGSHRKPLVDDRWNSVGHGAAEWPSTGQIIFVQHFTSAVP